MRDPSPPRHYYPNNHLTMKMRKTIITFVACLSLTCSHAQENATHGYPITPVPFTQVKVTPGTFWGQRL